MSYAKTKLRILSRRNFDKSDIESVYGELVRVVGGTYFSGGVAQGPANGLLDFRNFAPDAGILNSNKAAPNSLWPVQVPFRAYTAPAVANIKVALPWDNIGVVPLPSGTITGISLSYESMANATNAGNAVFSIVVQGGTTQVGTTISWTNATTTFASLGNQTGLSIAIAPRAVLQVAFTNNVNTTGICGIFWITSPHVK